jgi:hypothetical protein
MKAYRPLFAMLIALLCAAFVAAQSGSDLVIRSLNQAPTLPDGTIVVELDVLNEGATASAPTRVRLFNAAGVELTGVDVPALQPGVRQPVILTIPPGGLPSGGRQQVFVTVGLDVLPGGTALRPDIGSIGVDVPTLPGGVPTPTPVSPFDLENILRQPNFGLGQALGISLIALLALVLFVVVRGIVRALTPGERFDMWQPAYPPPPRIDPNTQDGRRYLWQGHAQNDASGIEGTPCQPDAVVARKVVTDANGARLAGWRITGVRTGRYDAYGRIARTHHPLSRGWLRRLGRAAGRRWLSPARARRIAQPIARAIARDIVRHADARTMMLPIALDIRFRSRRDDAAVAFTLLGCTAGVWSALDTWTSPPTRDPDGHPVDQYTWALAGQQAGERPRDMQRRLEGVLTGILAGMLARPKPERPRPAPRTPPAVTAPPTTETPHAPDDTPTAAP